MSSAPDWPREAPTLPLLLTEVPGPESLRIFAREQRLHSAGRSGGSLWSRLAIVAGRGAIVRDADGNYLLDACSGTVVMNTGHGDARVVEAITEQARRLTHFYDFAHELRGEFMEELQATLPDRFTAFHMTNSGAEAVEAALRIARSATGRHEVIAFHNAYHGRTLGALSLTPGPGREGLGPLLSGVAHVPSVYCYRSPVGNDIDSVVSYCTAELERVSTQVLSGPPAAVFIEPFQGAGGMIPQPAEFLFKIREFCDRTGALLVFDEILSGVGRTGKMWAFEHSGVVPDLLLLGKGLGAGYPIGVVAGPREVLDAGPGALPTRNSSTFGGGPLACAVGLACLRVLHEDRLVDNARRVGSHLLDQLRDELSTVSTVGEVRGLGLAIGVELVASPETRAPASPAFAEAVLVGLLREGVVISSSSHVIRITPPLCINEAQAGVVVRALGTVLRDLGQASSLRRQHSAS